MSLASNQVIMLVSVVWSIPGSIVRPASKDWNLARIGIAGEPVYDFYVMGWPFKDGLGGVVSLYGYSGPCGIKSRRAKYDAEK